MHYRPAATDDIPACIELMRRMHAASTTYKSMEFSESQTDMFARSLIGNEFAFFWVAATDSDEVIGLIAAQAYQPPWSCDLMVSDLAVYVTPEHRGSMAAVRLIAKLMAWCKDIHAKLVMLGVTTGEDDETAIKLYQRLGFEPRGTAMMMEV